MNTPNTPTRVVWRELMTDDLERAKGFYGELFGWVFKEMPMGPNMPPYTIANVGDKGIGGLMTKPDGNMPTFWLSYVGVPSADEALAKANAGGATTIFGPMEIPGVGKMAGFMDSDHAVIAMLQPDGPSQPQSMPQQGEFCWETLMASDPARARAFYGEVFGWTSVPGPSGNGDTVFGVGPKPEDMVADLQQAQGGMPPCWMTYVVVDEIEGARARAERLGGRVVVPLIEIPNVGRIALIADPTGGHLGIFQSAMR
ncbi:MAG: VOC family protein [Myxococcales bacterium]|nr:VOC family protein [Myxococcales bacterium]